MPRRKRTRRVSQAPMHYGFQVIHQNEEKTRTQYPVTLHIEEYEAIKLMDYELHSQAEAAEYMNVSRPTITRIYESARQKIAKAIVEGCPIHISGGDYELSDKWVECQSCQSTFTKFALSEKCPWCGSDQTTVQNK